MLREWVTTPAVLPGVDLLQERLERGQEAVLESVERLAAVDRLVALVGQVRLQLWDHVSAGVACEAAEVPGAQVAVRPVLDACDAADDLGGLFGARQVGGVQLVEAEVLEVVSERFGLLVAVGIERDVLPALDAIAVRLAGLVVAGLGVRDQVEA